MSCSKTPLDLMLTVPQAVRPRTADGRKRNSCCKQRRRVSSRTLLRLLHLHVSQSIAGYLADRAVSLNQYSVHTLGHVTLGDAIQTRIAVPRSIQMALRAANVHHALKNKRLLADTLTTSLITAEAPKRLCFPNFWSPNEFHTQAENLIC